MKWILSWAFAVLVVGAAAWFGLTRRPAPQREALHSREIAARGLAEFISKTKPAAKVLIVSNPYTEQASLPRAMRNMEEAGVHGVQAGLGDKARPVVAFPELKPGVLENPRGVFIDPESTTPLSFLVSDESFDKLVEQHSDRDVLVSLVGVPANLSRVKSWEEKSPVQFALLLPDLRMIGNRTAIRQAFESGKLIAFVAAKPRALANQTAGDTKADFEQQFVLVTRSNLQTSLQIYPQLFPPN